jgi:molybdenum cofactor biosynthesis enzyme MoaA
MLPYIGFPLLRGCLLRCQYCGSGGEASASTIDFADLRQLQRWTEIALAMGFQKFRLTGGEPFLHPRIAEILAYFSNIPAVCTLNTAGCAVTGKRSAFEHLGPNLQFICSLDSLDESTFDQLTGSRHRFGLTIAGIRLIAGMGRLKRLNMMVVKGNAHEVFKMIDFCAALGCDLKIADIAQTPHPFGDWSAMYEDLTSVEASLRSAATAAAGHPYTQWYGIPSTIYTVHGVAVTVKASSNGTTYAKPGPCQSCAHFPCGEGMYFISFLPDGSLSACRPNGFHVPATADVRRALEEMVSLFGGLAQMRPRQLKADVRGFR